MLTISARVGWSETIARLACAKHLGAEPAISVSR